MMLGSSSLLNDSGAPGRLTVRQFVAQSNLCATVEKPDGGVFRCREADVSARPQLAVGASWPGLLQRPQSTVAAGRALEKQPFEA